MPMNPRLLRPTEGGFRSPDADARAYLAAVRQADGANLEPAVAKAISDFVIGCKADGIWDAIKASCILAGARTLTGALTPLKGPAPTNVGPFVSGDYARGGATPGLVGNGSSKYLDAQRANNADPQDSQHLAVFVTAPPSATSAFIGSNGITTAGTSILLRDGLDRLITRMRENSSASVNAPSGSATGFIGASRAASTGFTRRFGGSSETLTVASQTPTSNGILVFSRDASSPGAVGNQRMSFYSIGESLDLALLDSRLSTLMTAIGAAIP
jgi:hypothetical protein